MSAETLRRAAELIRERAETTGGPREFPSPWSVERTACDEYVSFEVLCHEDRSGLVAEGLDEGPASHIASWHPAVALAVADWLDGVAARVDVKVSKGGNESAVWSHEIHALAVARAYLGEPSC